jgi:hypothetical protein
VGARFADFLATEPDVAPSLVDQARLDWARVEVFDAADAEPLRLADLQSIPPADWPALRLRPIPACRVVECAAAPAAIRVWREEWSVSQAAMGERERRAFHLLQQGEPFASLCAALEGDLDPEAAAREVGSLLMRWLEDGVLARLPAP